MFTQEVSCGQGSVTLNSIKTSQQAEKGTAEERKTALFLLFEQGPVFSCCTGPCKYTAAVCVLEAQLPPL